MELYRKDFLSATCVLVILDRLSKIEPSYYHADLLLFLLSRIGGSVENKLSRGACGIRSSGSQYAEGRSTIEVIYRRLDSLLPYVISTDSQDAYKQVELQSNIKRKRDRIMLSVSVLLAELNTGFLQILKERKRKKSRAKKIRSREDVPAPTNGLSISMRGQQQRQDNSNPEDSGEGVTSL